MPIFLGRGKEGLWCLSCPFFGHCVLNGMLELLLLPLNPPSPKKMCRPRLGKKEKAGKMHALGNLGKGEKSQRKEGEGED